MIRIKDIADELGLSTATVSNVIHGKTKKVSPETIKRVQKLLEEKQYVPNMAAVLLAQNSSKIICLVLSNDVKYEKHMLQDPFVSFMVDHLSKAIHESGYFMMLQEASDLNHIVEYASMWNMSGMILLGYCEEDYDALRARMHIPFVVISGYPEQVNNYANVGIDDLDGGYQMGRYLLGRGHEDVLFLSDNDSCGDHDRYMGLRKAMEEQKIEKDYEEGLCIIPTSKEERIQFYDKNCKELLEHDALFFASDTYAIEGLNYFVDHGYQIPDDISIAGYDDVPMAQIVRPALTTIRQDIAKEAGLAMKMLSQLIEGKQEKMDVTLPVELIVRDSVK